MYVFPCKVTFTLLFVGKRGSTRKFVRCNVNASMKQVNYIVTVMLIYYYYWLSIMILDDVGLTQVHFEMFQCSLILSFSCLPEAVISLFYFLSNFLFSCAFLL